MGMKISAKSSDYRKAKERLEAKGGTLEGTSKGIISALGFDGGWKEFIHNSGVTVKKTNLGRFCVSIPEQTEAPADKTVQSKLIDPEIFALCASAYILGEGNPNDFDNFEGEYNSVEVISQALALEIDSTIGALYLPYETESDINMYSVERSLFYTAPGDGTYSIYGSALLAHV